MVSVMWTKSITCSATGCTWKTPMGAYLKEMLKMKKLHTQEAHPPTMRESTATTPVEAIGKKEIIIFLKCSVCLCVCKPLSPMSLRRQDTTKSLLRKRKKLLAVWMSQKFVFQPTTRWGFLIMGLTGSKCGIIYRLI